MTMYKKIECLCREARNFGSGKELYIPLNSIQNYNIEYVRKILRNDFGFKTKIKENAIGDLIIHAF